MSNGYETWWRVPVSNVSNAESVVKAYDKMQEKINNLRKIEHV